MTRGGAKSLVIVAILAVAILVSSYVSPILEGFVAAGLLLYAFLVFWTWRKRRKRGRM